MVTDDNVSSFVFGGPIANYGLGLMKIRNKYVQGKEEEKKRKGAGKKERKGGREKEERKMEGR